jgi:hypothetical protein
MFYEHRISTSQAFQVQVQVQVQVRMQGPDLGLTQPASSLMVRLSEMSEMSEVIILERLGSWQRALGELHERPQQACLAGRAKSAMEPWNEPNVQIGAHAAARYPYNHQRQQNTAKPQTKYCAIPLTSFAHSLLPSLCIRKGPPSLPASCFVLRQRSILFCLTPELLVPRTRLRQQPRSPSHLATASLPCLIRFRAGSFALLRQDNP